MTVCSSGCLCTVPACKDSSSMCPPMRRAAAPLRMLSRAQAGRILSRSLSEGVSLPHSVHPLQPVQTPNSSSCIFINVYAINRDSADSDKLHLAPAASDHSTRQSSLTAQLLIPPASHNQANYPQSTARSERCTRRVLFCGESLQCGEGGCQSHSGDGRPPGAVADHGRPRGPP